MQVETMKLDPRIASIYYKDYRKSVLAHKKERLKRGDAAKKSEIEKEDEIFKAMYRALAQGKTILNLATVLGDAGLNDDGLPCLAVARADWTMCTLQVEHDHVVFAKNRWPRWTWRSHRYTDGSLAFRQTVFAPELWSRPAREAMKYKPLGGREAVVPSIPMHLRPTDSIERYHILWEAVWTKSPPVDPILLRHIAGHMYVVLAQWDLTPIERSVLERRIS